MGFIFRFIKFILIFSVLAVLAVTLGVFFAVAGAVFLLLSFLFGRRIARPTFRVYTTNSYQSPFEFERPPMRDVTPKKTDRLTRAEV